MPIFASAFRETTRNDGCKIARCGSSAWLERRPVTPEVEGSSPFRTAKVLEISSGLFLSISASALSARSLSLPK